MFFSRKRELGVGVVRVGSVSGVDSEEDGTGMCNAGRTCVDEPVGRSWRSWGYSVSSAPVWEGVAGMRRVIPMIAVGGIGSVMGSGVRNDRVKRLECMLSTSVDKAVNSCKSLIYER